MSVASSEPWSVSLLSPPSSVVMDGEPAMGSYVGCIDTIDWRALRGPWQRSALWTRLHHKRWQYVGVGHAHWFIGVAIVDVGWCMSSFVYVFDRRSQKVVLDWTQDGLPGWSGGITDQPVMGGAARFKGLGAALSIVTEGDVIAVRVKTRRLQLRCDLSWRQAPPFLLAVGPVDQGLVHATQKSPGLPVVGEFELDGERHALHGALGSLDSSNGLLARDTAWRWACAHDRRVGFNLQEGYFGNQENVLWLDGALIPLGAAKFDFDPQRPLSPWRVQTDDGLLDLHFRPEGARQADRNLVVAASYYIQPVGTFHGTVRARPGGAAVSVDGLLGVTEDHRSRW